MVKITLGTFDDSFGVASLKAYLAEFHATLIFVFAGVGSAIAYSKCLTLIFEYILINHIKAYRFMHYLC